MTQMYTGGYGYPAPPTPQNGLGTAGFVLGLLGLIFSPIPIVGVIAWPLVILGLIFSIIGLNRARSGKASNKGLCLAGIITSALGLLMCIIWVAAIGNAANNQAQTAVPPPSTYEYTGPLTAPAAPAPVAPQAPAVQQQTRFNVGETANVNGLQIKVGPLESMGNTFGPLLCSPVEMKNDSLTSKSYNIFYWELKRPDDRVDNATVFGDDLLGSGDLAPGDRVVGNVCFDRKDGQKGEYRIRHEALFSGVKTEWTAVIG